MSKKPRQTKLNYHPINSEESTISQPVNINNKFVKSPRPSLPSSKLTKERQLSRKTNTQNANQYLLRECSTNKPQNLPSDNSSPLENIIQYSASDDSAIVEVTVKTSSNFPKQRSKSTVSDHREPWGQLLKQHKPAAGKGQKEASVFCNFDPLRTLHFLAKELEIHIEALLPKEHNIHEIIKAMHLALKRVPPEVASTIHLQQSIGLLPGVKPPRDNLTCQINADNTEKEHKAIQTYEQDNEEIDKLRKLMAQNTIKLEASCHHLETICEQLKNEKNYLERELENEKTNVEYFRRKVNEIENLNKGLINNLETKDEQIKHLTSNIETLETKLMNFHSNKTEIKSMMSELKQSKTDLEQECIKLKHQLRLSGIEKEKYLAVLAVRDRQIREIRCEMAQLQEAVNEQLVELHSNALATIPSNQLRVEEINESKENATISSVQPNEKNSPKLDYQSKINHIQEMFAELKKQVYVSTANNNKASN